MKNYWRRRQSKTSTQTAFLAGVGGMLAIGLVGLLSEITGAALLMAPFGASCVLLFAVPQSPLSQPTNVVGGHVASTLVGLLFVAFLPEVWWAASLAVGGAIAAMSLLRVTHPPAGANPLVIFALQPGIGFLFFPVLLGAILLVIVAVLFHKMSGVSYPLRDE